MPLKPNRQIGKRSRKEDVLDAKKNRTWITPKGKKYEFDYEKQGSRYIFILIYKDNRMRVPESDWNRTDIDDLINSMEKGMAIENKKSNRLRQIIKEEIRHVMNETELTPGSWASDSQIDEYILANGGTDDDIEDWRNLTDYGDIQSARVEYVSDANEFLKKYNLRVSGVRETKDGNELEWKIYKKTDPIGNYDFEKIQKLANKLGFTQGVIDIKTKRINPGTDKPKKNQHATVIPFSLKDEMTWVTGGLRHIGKKIQVSRTEAEKVWDSNEVKFKKFHKALQQLVGNDNVSIRWYVENSNFGGPVSGLGVNLAPTVIFKFK